ncbi:MAG: hypothetical protein P9M15_01595 [Candidatus Electryoneaceae bacterium]|nr:hypothetical protein [Candidatus Electryoneaceae bacterium]
MTEVIIHYERMTDDEFKTVSESIAAIIVNHIQSKKKDSQRDNRMKDSGLDQAGANDGTVQPV